MFLVQPPIIVDVGRQAQPSHDISVDTALGIFLMPLVVLLVLLAGGAIVAGLVVLYKRWRDGSADAAAPEGHIRLRIERS